MSVIALDPGIQEALQRLGIQETNKGTSTGSNHFASGETIHSYSPVDGALIGSVVGTSEADYAKVISAASEAFKVWRQMPAPQRGEIVRQFGEKLRE